jgi:hypothetical protein
MSPTISAIIIANTTGIPASIAPAATVMLRARTAPTDRSMPPVRITIVIPTAMIALIETCRRTLLKFAVVRNWFDRNIIIVQRSTRPRTEYITGFRVKKPVTWWSVEGLLTESGVVAAGCIIHDVFWGDFFWAFEDLLHPLLAHHDHSIAQANYFRKLR